VGGFQDQNKEVNPEQGSESNFKVVQNHITSQELYQLRAAQLAGEHASITPKPSAAWSWLFQQIDTRPGIRFPSPSAEERGRSTLTLTWQDFIFHSVPSGEAVARCQGISDVKVGGKQVRGSEGIESTHAGQALSQDRFVFQSTIFPAGQQNVTNQVQENVGGF
jgi:hypothetical protein